MESKDILSVKDVEALVCSFSGDDNYPLLLWTRDFDDIMDVYKHTSVSYERCDPVFVHGLQDKTGASASMMYCTSLDELREKLLIYDQFRQVPGAVMNRAARYENTSQKTPVGQQSGEMRCFNCRKLGHRMSDFKQP
ncbi:hypothetical protein ACLKA6_014506 [Drosophila palustris]